MNNCVVVGHCSERWTDKPKIPPFLGHAGSYVSPENKYPSTQSMVHEFTEAVGDELDTASIKAIHLFDTISQSVQTAVFHVSKGQNADEKQFL